MVLLSFLNPFSEEAEQIVREKSSLEELFNKNKDLIDIIAHTNSQNISNDELIPHTLAELAVKRLEWFVRKKNDKKYDHNDYSFLMNPDMAIYDIISFYIAAQSIGIRFNPNSRESRVFIESQGQLVQERLEKLSTSLRKEVVAKLLNQLIPLDNISWTSLGELFGSRKINLTDLIIDQGEVILDKEDFIYRFSDKIIGRVPEKMYDILIGDQIKELIINRMIMQNTENYLIKVHEMASNIEAHPSLIVIADEISKMLKERTSIFSGSGGDIQASKLVGEAFPPCIKNTIDGVSSGNRNDAIVLLLTSFISYARLYPSVFKNETNLKISDLDKGLKITNNEILPVIYEAAGRCTPPLFEDDPQEKLNITAKLGFGVHKAPDLNNEGESKWYTPMSCEKIKIHLPVLCKPDKDCKKISNPLSYYNRRKWIMNQSPDSKSPEEKNKSTKKED
ncbi:MAG: DNA primase [Methanobacterium sp.]|nr:MAG: DNA primase [Methanobacterium sp.]